MNVQEEHRKYWKSNIRLVSVLLVIWFFVSCVLGVIFVEDLNEWGRAPGWTAPSVEAVETTTSTPEQSSGAAVEKRRDSFGGFPLGFWVAQQGSIFTFIILILIYAVSMDRLDKKYHVGEKGEKNNA